MLHCNRQLAPNPLLAGNHSSADVVDGVTAEGLVAVRGAGDGDSHFTEVKHTCSSLETPMPLGSGAECAARATPSARCEVLQHSGTAGVLLWLSNSSS